MRVTRGGKRGLVVIATALVGAVLVTVPWSGATPVAAQQAPPTPSPNPPIQDKCGLDVTLVLDASGSINSSNAVDDVRGAAKAFLDALQGTSSRARVTQFGTASEELAGLTVVSSASLQPGGALATALSGYYPAPDAPSGRVFRQYDGSGNPQDAVNWGSSNTTQRQYTNWDQALDDAQTPADLVVFLTDGDPTAYDLDQTGDPFDGIVIGYNTNRNEANAFTINRAIEEANGVKTGSRRILAVGVGSALGNTDSVNRLIQVSGPQVVRDAQLGAITSLNQVDVALVTQFDQLAQFLRSVVLQLCSPSLTIRKLAQSPTSAEYVPAPGWNMRVTPSALPPGTGFRWILPDAAPAPFKDDITDGNGFAQFQWEPVPPESNSQAAVQETLLAGYTAGRPSADDFVCEFRNESGIVRRVAGELGPTLTFTLNPIGQEIGTCTVWNSFDYAPAIAITKVNSPTAVRGDVTPPTIVTSAFVVTNTGNTPLDQIAVVDDKCGAAVQVTTTGGRNVGDTNANGLLDPDPVATREQWQFACAKDVVTRRRAAAPFATVINTAQVFGTDPAGTTVTATASDDVDVYVPAISVTKLVDNPATTDPAGDVVTVLPSTPVVYSYAVTNIGNTPLGTVTLTDDRTPCTNPTPAPGNTPPPLMPGQAWNYSCGATPPSDVVNTAAVTAVPLNPQDNLPFAGSNPNVTDSDPAEVQVETPGITLVKSVTPTTVLIGPSGAAEPVTYSYQATNTGTLTLDRPGGEATQAPGWIIDDTCAPVDFEAVVTGDADDLFELGEVWGFTCADTVVARTQNTAELEGQPVDTAGDPVGPTVTDDAAALVDIATPGIDVHKTALRGVVLDPGAEALLGPDVPDRRPAGYLYEVINTGNVPLDLTPDPPTDSHCTDLAFDPGSDANGDGLLDVDESWIYTCTTVLDREEDANTPPNPGDLTGLVTNTVTVVGVPSFQDELVTDKLVTANDTAQVSVIEPGIGLTKTASAAVILPETDVTYTFAVTNTGDVGLDVLGPSDDECAPLVFAGGDGNDNGLLDGADSGARETWTYTCAKTLGMPTPPETSDTNDAAVFGIDPLGNVYGDVASADVRVFDPAIDLVKSVSDELVLTGSTVTYDFVVTNVGGSPIAADDVLAEIQLVDVSAPPVPSCVTPAFVGGDTNANGLLEHEPAETWTYQCAATITTPTTDIAVVRGTGGGQFEPPLPVDVFDSDAAFVQPFRPGIEVTKSASPTTLPPAGGPVTYTYTVRNTGDVPLRDVASRITDNTCSPVTYVSGDEDADGLLDTPNSIFEDALDETWIFTCTTTVSTTTTNTVVVPGTPTDPGGTPLCTSGPAGESILQVPGPCDTSDDATATVTVVAPGTITIVKRTPLVTSATFDFTFGAETFSLQRDVPRTFTGVAPGTYTVTETAVSGWRTSNIVCTDATGDSVVTVTERQATIVVAPGETVTCEFTNVLSGLLPQTGNNDLRQMLSMGTMLAAVGALLLLFNRRYRLRA